MGAGEASPGTQGPPTCRAHTHGETVQSCGAGWQLWFCVAHVFSAPPQIDLLASEVQDPLVMRARQEGRWSCAWFSHESVSLWKDLGEALQGDFQGVHQSWDNRLWLAVLKAINWSINQSRSPWTSSSALRDSAVSLGFCLYAPRVTGQSVKARTRSRFFSKIHINSTGHIL